MTDKPVNFPVGVKNAANIARPDFAVQGERIADALVQAAEEQLLEAENILARTKILADNIKQQISEHSTKLADINRRVRALGESVLAAHDKFINDK